MNRLFPEEEIQMANTHKKTGSSFSTTREIQIKTATRFLVSLTRLEKILKSAYIKPGQTRRETNSLMLMAEV